MTNYELNMRKIIDDYYKCIGSFYNCYKLYEQKDNNLIIISDMKEQVAIKKGMQEDLLSNLGKVGEKAFKYIIGLENLTINPNQDENTFESLWKKSSALKEFARKHGIEETNEKLIELINYHDDNNQKGHNFHYWFSVMNTTMPSISNKFEKYMEYNIQSKILINDCHEKEEFKYTYELNYENITDLALPFRAAIFPNLLELKYESIPSIPKNILAMMIKSRKKAIKKNGDIFTRLRYASNNQNNLSFDINEVFNLIKNIIVFISMIHENNNNLNFDLNKAFAKYKALEYKEYLGMSEEEIKNIFTLDLTGTELALTAFENNYSYENIKKLLEIGVPKEDLRKVIRERLQSRTVKYFFDMGIRNYEKMRSYLDYYIENGNVPLEEKRYKK